MEDKTTYYTFESGLRLVHRRVESPVTYMGIMVGAGTRDERPDENGLAHFIEHCVFKGTANRTSRQIINQIETMGGEINAYTTKEETTFYVAVPEDCCRKAMDVLFDMVLRPTFPREEISKERRVIYDEIESYNDSPSELIFDDFESLVFAGKSLAQPILGTKKTLRYFTADKAKAFMQREYRPERMVVFADTNMPFDRFLKMVEREVATAEWKEEKHAPRLCACCEGRTIDVCGGQEEKHAEFHKHTHQAHVMIGGVGYPISHERQLCAYLINNILGGGAMNSRLNLSLREQKGLVYTVESIYTPLSDTGYWSVYFATDPENKAQCMDLVKSELERMKDGAFSEAMLQKALRQLRGQMAIAAENRENMALAMAKSVLYRGRSFLWEETFAKIAEYTVDDVRETARELFAEGNIYCLQYC